MKRRKNHIVPNLITLGIIR